MKIKYKKGDLPDMLIFLVTLTILAIGLFIFAFIIPTIADGLAGAGLNSSTEGAEAIHEMGLIGTELMQRGFFFLFVGLIMGIMITSFLVRTHPIFIFMYIFFLGITILLGTYMGNFYETLTSSPVFADTLASQTLINVVMNNITKIPLGVGALRMVIIFAKFSSGASLTRGGEL